MTTKRLCREIQILSRVKHSNIVRLLDVHYEESGNSRSASLLFEPCRGGELFDFVNVSHRPLQPPPRSPYMYQKIDCGAGAVGRVGASGIAVKMNTFPSGQRGPPLLRSLTSRLVPQGIDIMANGDRLWQDLRYGLEHNATAHGLVSESDLAHVIRQILLAVAYLHDVIH
jgi:serine/threonine protein kinase